MHICYNSTELLSKTQITKVESCVHQALEQFRLNDDELGGYRIRKNKAEFFSSYSKSDLALSYSWPLTCNSYEEFAALHRKAIDLSKDERWADVIFKMSEALNVFFKRILVMRVFTEGDIKEATIQHLDENVAIKPNRSERESESSFPKNTRKFLSDSDDSGDNIVEVNIENSHRLKKKPKLSDLKGSIIEERDGNSKQSKQFKCKRRIVSENNSVTGLDTDVLSTNGNDSDFDEDYDDNLGSDAGSVIRTSVNDDGGHATLDAASDYNEEWSHTAISSLVVKFIVKPVVCNIIIIGIDNASSCVSLVLTMFALMNKSTISVTIVDKSTNIIDEFKAKIGKYMLKQLNITLIQKDLLKDCAVFKDNLPPAPFKLMLVLSSGNSTIYLSYMITCLTYIFLTL
jgi:hypothetical protein